MENTPPIASTSTSTGQFGERDQSPSQETLHQNVAEPRPAKRKLSTSLSESPAPTPLPLPPSQPSTSSHVDEPTLVQADDTAPSYPLVAPLPQFAPPPPTLPSHPSFEFFTTRSHPFNKHNFRYTPCGPSPHSPLPVPPQRQIESLPRSIRFSWEDRSVFTYLTQDARTITTDKGWRGVRTNVGMREGDWFWEFTIDRGGGEGGRELNQGDGLGSWVRVGVGRRESGLNAPVGVDGHSYGVRDKTGDKVHSSHSEPFGKPFSSRSTIGIYLSLPRQERTVKTSSRDPNRIMRKRIPIFYKNQLYFEQLEYTPSKEMEELLVDPSVKAKQESELELKKKNKASAPGTKPKASANDEDKNRLPLRELKKLKGSKMGVWIDGEFQGTAFEDLYDFIPLMKQRGKGQTKKSNRLVGENHHDDGSLGYYPFVSVFGGGIVSINPGPELKFTPKEEDLARLHGTNRTGGESGGLPRWRPLSERYEEFYAEQARLDDLDELEQIKLLADVREKEIARLQRQADKAERALAASAYDRAGGGGVTKKAKTGSTTETTMSGSDGAGLGLIATMNQVIGKAKGQEESPGNSPRPVFASGDDQVKVEGV